MFQKRDIRLLLSHLNTPSRGWLCKQEKHPNSLWVDNGQLFVGIVGHTHTSAKVTAKTDPPIGRRVMLSKMYTNQKGTSSLPLLKARSKHGKDLVAQSPTHSKPKMILWPKFPSHISILNHAVWFKVKIIQDIIIKQNILSASRLLSQNLSRDRK